MPTTKENIQTVMVDVGELKPSEYNPRQATKEEFKQLKTSIERFGIVDPIIANKAEARKNIIIGGHFRLRVAISMGFKQVPVVYLDIPDIKREQELNLRLNKNLGEWDIELLAGIDEELLKDVGFSDREIEEAYDMEAQNNTVPEVEFTKELLLEHNYVVLYFDNPLDWEVAKEKFQLKEVKDLIPRKGQPKGIGRVVNGKDWLNRIQ